MKGTITAPGHVNGKYAGEVSVHWDGESIDVSSSIDAEPEPAPVPTPAPPVTPEPGGWLGLTVHLADERGRTNYMLNGPRIRKWKLITSDNPNLSGDINISEMTGYEHVFRRMWISETSGGPPIDGRAEVSGVSGRKISWSQKPSFMNLRLHLIPGRAYYLNISAPKETSRTGFYLTFGSKS